MTEITWVFAALAALGWIVVLLQRKKSSNFANEGGSLARECEKLRRDNAHYLKFAEDVLRERDRAMTLYQRFGAGAANAQNWLLRDLQAALRELNVYRTREGREPAVVHPDLQMLVDEYPENIARTVAEVPPAVLSDEVAPLGAYNPPPPAKNAPKG
jgi:hypothetical protein